MKLTNSAHTLDHVTKVVVHGWAGKHRVVPREDGGRLLRLSAPERRPDEYWIFARADDVLIIHPSTLGIPGIMTSDRSREMTFQVPPDLVGTLKVEMAAFR